MQEKLDSILDQVQKQIAKANTNFELNQIKSSALGKSSSLTLILRDLPQLPAAERPKFGQAVNHIKQAIQALLTQRQLEIDQLELSSKLASETIDITLAGRGQSLGHAHPVTQTLHRVEQLFHSIGFETVLGPELETVYYNFAALNIPDHHPARQMVDTFYLPDGKLLRSHTSNTQVRVMEQQKPPIRIITPGRVYRRDSDPTHSPMFHQLEGLMIDKNVTFAELKGILYEFLQHFFEKEVSIRLRPSYFPFTEPSAEVDIQCLQCAGQTAECRVCGGSGWLEVLGCGIVHPNVLEMSHIDPEQYTGFAFGIGLDRMAMLKFGVNDLRLFFENDIRFLQQF